MSRVRAGFDDALFGPETGSRLLVTQSLLAGAIALRLVLTPFTRFVDVPDGLWYPVPILAFVRSAPPAALVVTLQLVGAVAALAAAARRRHPRVTFAIAWACYLALAGLRASRGKVLHNDLLLLWVSAPFLFAPLVRRAERAQRSRAAGWPVRTAIVTMALVYVFAAYHKLRRSGPGWVFGDNMTWIMRWAPYAGEPGIPSLTAHVADSEILARLAAASILAFELSFPIVIWVRRARPLYSAAAVVLHAGTWALLGLDYWMWALTVPIVLIDWAEVVERVRSRGVRRSRTAADPVMTGTWRLGSVSRHVGRGRGPVAAGGGSPAAARDPGAPRAHTRHARPA